MLAELASYAPFYPNFARERIGKGLLEKFGRMGILLHTLSVGDVDDN